MNASHSQKDKKRETVICLASQFNIVFIKPHEQVCLSTHRVWSDTAFINTNSLLLQYFLIQLNNLPPRVVSSL